MDGEEGKDGRVMNGEEGKGGRVWTGKRERMAEL